MLSYRDIWTERGYRRQIEGCTLKVLLSPTDGHHASAARQLHNFCGFFGYDGPLVIGRGCYNTWRPEGFANRGTKILYALEAYSPDMSRETFTSIFARPPNERQYLPGEVVVYGQCQLAVCIEDPYEEIAIALHIFSASDPVMCGFPSHLSRQDVSTVTPGFNLLDPIWGLAVSVGEWFQTRNELATQPTDPLTCDAHRGYLEFRRACLDEDIHDFLYLAYSQARHRSICVEANDPNLATLRTCVEGYLRSFDQNNPTDEAMREMVTDYFIQIGFYPRGNVLGPRHDMYGQPGW